MSLTAIQDYVITAWEFANTVWHAVDTYAMYILSNVLLFHAHKKNGGHPWLAVAEMNTITVCLLPVVLFSAVILAPYLCSLEDSPCAWARWIAQHVVVFFVVFNLVFGGLLSWFIHRMFKRHKQCLDRARGRGSVSSDEEAALAKKM